MTERFIKLKIVTSEDGYHCAVRSGTDGCQYMHALRIGNRLPTRSCHFGILDRDNFGPLRLQACIEAEESARG